MTKSSIALALVLVACQAKADAPQSNGIAMERIGSTHWLKVYRFRDGGVVCYMAERGINGGAISCLREAQ